MAGISTQEAQQNLINYFEEHSINSAGSVTSSQAENNICKVAGPSGRFASFTTLQKCRHFSVAINSLFEEAHQNKIYGDSGLEG